VNSYSLHILQHQITVVSSPQYYLSLLNPRFAVYAYRNRVGARRVFAVLCTARWKQFELDTVKRGCSVKLRRRPSLWREIAPIDSELAVFLRLVIHTQFPPIYKSSRGLLPLSFLSTTSSSTLLPQHNLLFHLPNRTTSINNQATP
jgi:hypothetical protein